MAWVVFDSVTRNVQRIDMGISQPPDSNSEFSVSVTTWPQPPASNVVLRWRAGVLVWEDDRTLNQKKADKWEQIKQIRTGLIDASIVTTNGTFNCDLNSRNSLIGTALRAQMMAGKLQPVAITFTLADNMVVTLDLAKIISVVLQIGSREQAARDVATGLRTQIEAATTTTQLDAITWPT